MVLSIDAIGLTPKYPLSRYTVSPGCERSTRLSWHPLPGTNLIDHLLFSATFSHGLAQRIMIRTINGLVRELCDPHSIETMAVCGNTGQLSLLMGTEIRDLLMSPASLERKGIQIPDRQAQIVDARTLGLEVSCDLLVPPAIPAEIGADALALIHKSGMVRHNSVMAVDLGTIAKMAPSASGKIYVGSAAAGPAIEGQQIQQGMLAAPEAIASIRYGWGWMLQVLNDTCAWQMATQNRSRPGNDPQKRAGKGLLGRVPDGRRQFIREGAAGPQDPGRAGSTSSGCSSDAQSTRLTASHPERRCRSSDVERNLNHSSVHITALEMISSCCIGG